MGGAGLQEQPEPLVFAVVEKGTGRLSCWPRPDWPCGGRLYGQADSSIPTNRIGMDRALGACWAQLCMEEAENEQVLVAGVFGVK